MDDIILAVLIGAVTFAMLTGFLIFSNRDTNRNKNETERLIAAQQAETQSLIAKLDYNGKQEGISSNERLALARLKTSENCEQLKVKMHEAEMEMKKVSIETDFKMAKMSQDGQTLRTEIMAKSQLQMNEGKILFKKYEVDTKKDMFVSQLNSNEKMFGVEMGFKTLQLETEFKMAELGASTTKYVADTSYKTQKMVEKGNNSRFQLGCQTQLEMSRDSNHTLRHKFDTIKDVKEKEIKSRENCFKEQLNFQRFKETETTRRAQIESDAATSNPLNILGALPLIGPLLGGGPMAAAVPALSAIQGSTSRMLTNSNINSSSSPIIEEIE